MDRRLFLGLGAGSAASLFCTRLSFAAAQSERRLIFVIQRGAMDGLHAVPPVGDPDYLRLRRTLAVDAATAHPLDGMFALHPSLVETSKMYQAGEALVVHAVASPYRDRSHFDGQNVIETGGALPYAVKDGWINRLAGVLASSGSSTAAGLGKPPIGFSQVMPMALRGRAPTVTYAPSRVPSPESDLMARVARLYESDNLLHPLWSAAVQTRGMAASLEGEGTDSGALAARFLNRPDGPRIAMIETTGWDTHNQQATRLNGQLGRLDRLLASLKTGLGANWHHTTVLVATEFGRTVAVNGTQGTDHGTGTVALLLGGAVKGGRVLADWPGLAQAALYENRDLRPTTRLDALIAGVVVETFALDGPRVLPALFPDLPAGQALRGLLRV